jgi:GAF domain-containing protein
LRSALAVPIPGSSSTLGVLALYCGEADAFTRDQLDMLEAVTSEVAPAIEKLIRNRQTNTSAFAASAGFDGSL